MAFRTSSNRSRRSSLKGAVDVVMVSMPRIKSSDELLREAISNLRCIAWEDIDRELMSTSSAPTSDDLNNLFERSRPLRRGEKIDFFMSHSWRDDAEQKFSALERVVAHFKKKNGRFPTFWLDKVCIDQRSIQDGLKVLPININACDKVLVLCGATYPHRLWCVWELFTLFAFADDSKARAKIVFEPVRAPTVLEPFATVHAEGGEEEKKLDEPVATSPALVPEGLTNFQLSTAHCFDPNEERRLRGVIEARGVEVFETRVRELAEQCQLAIDEAWGNAGGRESIRTSYHSPSYRRRRLLQRLQWAVKASNAVSRMAISPDRRSRRSSPQPAEPGNGQSNEIHL